MTPEQKREYNQKYYNENKEKVLSQKREYNRKNNEALRKYRKKYYEENKEAFTKTQRSYYSTEKGRKIRMLAKAKSRAAEINLEFKISLEDLVIPSHCPYLGIKLTHELGKGQLHSNSSIDRIDSSKGYIKGNVQVISRLANTMKSNATSDQLITFAKNVLRLYKGQTVLDYKTFFEEIIQ